jgi:hypothetical protein
MMRVLKSIVEIAFEIEGRGCVICPGLLYVDNPAVRIGDHIDLLRPDGSEIRTSIRGIEMIRTTERKGLPVLLPRDIHKNDVPPGTVLLIYEDSPRDTDPDRSCFAIGDTVRSIANHRIQHEQSGIISESSWSDPNQIWHYTIRTSDQSNSVKFTATDLELQEKAT